MVTVWVSRETENSQLNRAKPPMLPTICGTAVETIVVSIAASAIVSTRPRSTGPRRGPAGGGGGMRAPRSGGRAGAAVIMRLHRSGGRGRGHRAVCSSAVTRCPGTLRAEEDGVDLQLRGKRAIVTGGSPGIGLAVAHRLAGEGAAVALVARDPARLAEAAEEVRVHGTEIVVRP